MTLAKPDDIVAALRDYRCRVVEHPGWRTRGTGYRFDPIGQLFHHDAFSEAVSDARALEVLIGGRPDLRGPLQNGWIDSDSRVVLTAYGNANHAGWGEADVLERMRRGLAPLGDARADSDRDSVVGNTHLWGWECRNAGDGVDVWEQLDAMERAGAALADCNGWGAQRIAGHKEWTARKIDPRGIHMPTFRGDVDLIITAHHAPAIEPVNPHREHDMILLHDVANKRMWLDDGRKLVDITAWPKDFWQLAGPGKVPVAGVSGALIAAMH